jgi:hypothetical protein
MSIGVAQSAQFFQNELSPKQPSGRRPLLLRVRQSFVKTAPPFPATSHTKPPTSHNPISNQGNILQSGHAFLNC